MCHVSLSSPDRSLPSGESVTVFTELEVEIQQCRLRHVMEAPTLGPLHAHCNKREKKSYVTSHFAFYEEKETRYFILQLQRGVLRFVIGLRSSQQSSHRIFAARLTKIINRIFSDVAITWHNALTERIYTHI